MDCGPPGSFYVDFPGKNTGVGCYALFQGIFPTQGLNLPHWRQSLYYLSHRGSPVHISTPCLSVNGHLGCFPNEEHAKTCFQPIKYGKGDGISFCDYAVQMENFILGVLHGPIMDGEGHMAGNRGRLQGTEGLCPTTRGTEFCQHSASLGEGPRLWWDYSLSWHHDCSWKGSEQRTQLSGARGSGPWKLS